MSKGYGRIQRGIIDATEGEDRDEDGVPQWLSIEDLALHIYGSDKPTSAQREAIRRAAHQLAEDAKVEAQRWPIHDRDGGEVDQVFPAGTEFYCRTPPGRDDCEGCAMGLEQLGGRDNRSKKYHLWPTERTITKSRYYGTTALHIRQALTDEERETEKANREKSISEVMAILKGAAPIPE